MTLQETAQLLALARVALQNALAGELESARSFVALEKLGALSETRAWKVEGTIQAWCSTRLTWVAFADMVVFAITPPTALEPRTNVVVRVDHALRVFDGTLEALGRGLHCWTLPRGHALDIEVTPSWPEQPFGSWVATFTVHGAECAP